MTCHKICIFGIFYQFYFNTLEPDHATVAYVLQRRSSRITQPLRTEIRKIVTNVIFNSRHRMTTQIEAQTLIYLYGKLQPCTHSELFLVIFTST